MVIPELVAVQQSKLDASVRKHAATNCIIRRRVDERSTLPLYETHTALPRPLTHAQTLNELLLRVNVLELNQNVLERELAVSRGYGTPLAEAIKLPSNVFPMRMTDTERTSKSGPIVQPGNEALKYELPMPDQPVLLALPAPYAVKSSVTLPDLPSKAPKVVVPVSSTSHATTMAANDEDMLCPPEVAAKLAEITDESPDLLADMAFQYGMDIVEASQILHREYSRRELHCYNRYGMSRTDVQLTRLMRQKGYVTRQRGECVNTYYPHRPNSNFWSYWVETSAMSHAYKLRSEQTMAVYAKINSMFTAPLVPGEKKYRAKMVLRRKAAISGSLTTHKPSLGDSLVRQDKLVKALYVPPAPTVGSTLRMLGSFVTELKDRGRRLLGRPPVLRSLVARAWYKNERISVENFFETFKSADPSIPTLLTLVPEVPKGSTTDIARAAAPPKRGVYEGETQADVVRRYHAGMGIRR